MTNQIIFRVFLFMVFLLIWIAGLVVVTAIATGEWNLHPVAFIGILIPAIILIPMVTVIIDRHYEEQEI